MLNNNLKEIACTDGTLPSHSWPGFYPMFYVTQNQEVICPKCANVLSKSDEGEVVNYNVYWEGEPLECSMCDKEIESAYGVPDEYV